MRSTVSPTSLMVYTSKSRHQKYIFPNQNICKICCKCLFIFYLKYQSPVWELNPLFCLERAVSEAIRVTGEKGKILLFIFKNLKTNIKDIQDIKYPTAFSDRVSQTLTMKHKSEYFIHFLMIYVIQNYRISNGRGTRTLDL